MVRKKNPTNKEVLGTAEMINKLKTRQVQSMGYITKRRKSEHIPTRGKNEGYRPRGPNDRGRP